MDSNLVLVIIIGLFVIVVIAAFLRFKQGVSAEIKGPWGTGLNLNGSINKPVEKSIDAQGVVSRQGGISLKDSTGRGIKAENIEAEKDINISTSDTASDKSALAPSISAKNFSAGRDNNIAIDINNFPPSIPLIDGLDEKRGRADWALLSKLWKLIEPNYINELDTQTQNEMIHQKTYYNQIVEYLKLRSQAHNQFHHAELEKAFSEFDIILRKFDSTMGQTYTGYPISNVSQLKTLDPDELEERMWMISAKKEAHFNGHWLDEKTYENIQEKYDDLVKCSINLLKQSKNLSLIVRSIAPDFFAE